jgi:hypothetical protein
MALTRVFVSFDYENDNDLKPLLIGQSKHPDSPFAISDWSIKGAQRRLEGQGPPSHPRLRRRRRRLRHVHTHTATGVNVEVKIAQEEAVPYFLLEGRGSKTCTKPTAAKSTDKMYSWTWANLKSLVGGSR